MQLATNHLTVANACREKQQKHDHVLLWNAAMERAVFEEGKKRRLEAQCSELTTDYGFYGLGYRRSARSGKGQNEIGFGVFALYNSSGKPNKYNILTPG